MIVKFSKLINRREILGRTDPYFMIIYHHDMGQLNNQKESCENLNDLENKRTKQLIMIY